VTKLPQDVEVLGKEFGSGAERWDNNLFVSDADFLFGQVELLGFVESVGKLTHSTHNSS
jgi:hypothetical protein